MIMTRTIYTIVIKKEKCYKFQRITFNRKIWRKEKKRKKKSKIYSINRRLND